MEKRAEYQKKQERKKKNEERLKKKYGEDYDKGGGKEKPLTKK